MNTIISVVGLLAVRCICGVLVYVADKDDTNTTGCMRLLVNAILASTGKGHFSTENTAQLCF